MKRHLKINIDAQWAQELLLSAVARRIRSFGKKAKIRLYEEGVSFPRHLDPIDLVGFLNPYEGEIELTITIKRKEDKPRSDSEKRGTAPCKQ